MGLSDKDYEMYVVALFVKFLQFFLIRTFLEK